MSLPKEPRQKMINMMYLVLTAMLALNVSSEILNAFVTVNNSITKSNGVISDKNKMAYESFAEKLKDAQTQAQAAAWAPKLKKLRNCQLTYLPISKSLRNSLRLKQEPIQGMMEKRKSMLMTWMHQPV